MARRKRTAPVRIVGGVLVLAAVAAVGWAGYRHLARNKAPLKVSAERIEVANDGRMVQVAGKLTAAAGARDQELGVNADAAVLFRKVEMFQWRERCAGATCSYEALWSSKALDSHQFRQAQGHENPPMRLADALFPAEGIRLGAFSVDGEVVAAQVAPVDHPVKVADMAPNLAASFADANGTLYAGTDPAHPRVGEVRVSYRIAPLGDAVLRGVQHGSRLTAQ